MASTTTISLQLRRNSLIKTPSSIQFFSSSSSSSFPQPPPPPPNDKDETTPSPPSQSQSQPSFTSYFKDLKSTLKQPSQQPQSPFQRPQQTPINPPLNPPTKAASFDEIRKNLSEFRNRTAAPPPPGLQNSSFPSPSPSRASNISFQELKNKNVAARGDLLSNADSPGKGVGKMSYDMIRESLKELKKNRPVEVNRGDDMGNRSKLTDSLFGPAKSTPVYGGTGSLPANVFGKEENRKKQGESGEMKTKFLRMYTYGGLGKRLKMLRPEEAKQKKGKWFSLKELRERLVKLREVEGEESQADPIAFRRIRESLQKLSSEDDGKKKSTVMEGFSFDHINSLEKSRTNWKIKARVTRMWSTVSPDSGTTKAFNLILLDDDNSHIHAFSFADVWRVIGKNVVEGSVYIIDTFIVKDAAGILKPVSSDSIIRFTNATTFQPCPDDVMIPAHKFEFLDLGDLFAEASLLAPNENPEFAIDVIGVVENFEKVTKQPTKFGERDIVRFRVCDTSNRHRVGVWGDLAKVVSEEFFKFSPDDRIIVILTSTKISTYKSSVQLSTLPSSKIYFNLAHESVYEMRQRLEEEGYKSTHNTIDSSTALTVVSPFQKASLKDLFEKAAQYVDTKLFCTFSISKLEEATSWFIYSCSKCKLQVFEIGKRFKCEKCPRNMPVAEKRFQIKATVEDPTYSCTLFIMDHVVKRLSSAFE